MDLVTLYNRQIQWLKLVKSYQDRGISLYIPFNKRYSRLRKYYPGWMRGENILITANSGIGKSKFIKDLLIDTPIGYVKRNPELNVKIFWNNLEDSGSQVITGFISKEIYRQSAGKKRKTFFELNGYKGRVDDQFLEDIANTEEYIKSINPYVDFMGIKNPYGIYKKVRAYLATRGKFYTLKKVNNVEVKDKEVVPYKIDSNGNVVWINNNGKTIRWDTYEPNDPTLFVFLINDRLWKMSAEKGKSKYDTILYWMDHYCADMLCNKFGVICCNVQQQASDKEKIETNFKGKTLEQKLHPSLDGLANVKQTQQSVTFAMGIFAPVRYNIENHGSDGKGNSYNIRYLQDYYRSLHLLKTRNGVGVSKIFPMYFDGAIDRYSDMPELGSPALEKLYQKTKSLIKV